MKVKTGGIILTLALILAITLGFIPGMETAMTVHAADAPGVSDTWENIAWEFDGKTLTVSKADGASSGDMSSYCYLAWEEYTSIIEKVVIEEGVTSIGYRVFSGCSNLSSIIIPESVTSIGMEAFYNCSSLASITIPESVISIGKSAFSGCSSLTSITIPTGVTSIEPYVFSRCTGLKSITIPTEVTSIGDDAFNGCSSLTSITIPENVASIGYRVFSGCSSLTSVTISEGVTDIGYVFSGCSSLTSITIPESVTSIVDRAFSGCSSLTSITIPTGVTSIGDRAFSGCSSLKSITIPESVTSIGEDAFYECTSLTNIKIPAGVTSIEPGVFYECTSLKSITIPETVTSIGASAFSGCSSLTSIAIPTRVTSIEPSVFYECISLKSIIIPENVTSIGVSAFKGCSSLTSITIPTRVTSIGDYAFHESSLENVKLPCTLKGQIYYTRIFSSYPTYTYTHAVNTCTANDTTDMLTGTCACGEKIYTATLKAPTKTAYTGKAIEATYINNIPDFTPTITYTGNKLINGRPVVPGSYTATLSYGETASVSLKYTITEAAAPAKPHKITNVVSGVHVYWPAVSGVSKYGLWRSETGINGTYKWIANPTVAHFTDTKVESGKTYYYKVTTLDTVNNVHSAKSTAIGITYVATPDITLRVNRAVGIGLGWDKISGATGYAIYRKPYDGNADWVRVATITNQNTLTWNDTSVKTANGNVYKYTIRALAGSDSKTLSGCRATGRTMVRLTSRDLNSATKASATSIKCNWSTTTQATGYEVRFMVGNTVYKTYTIGNYKTGTKTFTGLKAGQTYKIQVRTYKKVDGVGSFYSAWSTAKTVSL